MRTHFVVHKMEIITLTILVGIMLVIALLDKQFAFLGVAGGIGLVMIALTLQTGGLQYVTGYNVTINTVLNSSTTIQNLVDFSDMWLKNLVSLVIAGVGILITLTSAIKHGGIR